MTRTVVNWRTDYQLWLELFVVSNFAGLILDIALAHAENHFRRGSEYVPLYFSIGATIALAVVIVLRDRSPRVWNAVGQVVGWLAVLVGLAGVLLHLDSQFFHERTIRSLTYAAPFAAPLAFTGLGLLLLLNRLVPARAPEWAQWVLLLALGGFVGNFVFSLTDHAQNGFFRWIEWMPVISSAGAIGFLLVPFVMRVSPAYLQWCAAMLLLQAVVGLIGFLLHAREMLQQPGATLLDRVLNGPPPMAPLLFVNLALLGLIALWVSGVNAAASSGHGTVSQ